MFDRLVSGIAVKIMLGVIVALLVTSVGGCVIKNGQYSKLEKQFTAANTRIERLSKDVGTLKANQANLEGSLSQCNNSVQNVADARTAIADAGVKALQQIQQAGRSVDRKVAAIDAMPKETCEDALKILKSH